MTVCTEKQCFSPSKYESMDNNYRVKSFLQWYQNIKALIPMQQRCISFQQILNLPTPFSCREIFLQAMYMRYRSVQEAVAAIGLICSKLRWMCVCCFDWHKKAYKQFIYCDSIIWLVLLLGHANSLFVI